MKDYESNYRYDGGIIYWLMSNKSRLKYYEEDLNYLSKILVVEGHWLLYIFHRQGNHHCS